MTLTKLSKLILTLKALNRGTVIVSFKNPGVTFVQKPQIVLKHCIKLKIISASPIPSGYTYVPGLGCISYALSMLSYSDHRTNCISEGGDLLDVDPSPTVGLLFLDFFR